MGEALGIETFWHLPHPIHAREVLRPPRRTEHDKILLYLGIDIEKCFDAVAQLSLNVFL
jgi:hypothetical protein